jgi:2-polyprenyl-6-methoxyphenol hydroxylase-like FAD-dependent oxidoreductase
MAIVGHHAVVLGCGMSGLTAARVLAEHFVRVTLIERDRSSETGLARAGTPQAAHAHLLLSSGCSILQRLFPGYRAEMMVRGAIEADLCDDGRWYGSGGRLTSKASRLRSLLATRALLEGHARERVLRLHNVSAIDDCEVLALLGSAERVRGVRMRRLGVCSAEPEQLTADLVIDATGRDSQTPLWLERLGLPAPAEDRIHVDMTYTTRVYPRTPNQLDGQLLSVIYPQRPNLRCGIALAIEDSRWLITLGDGIGRRPASDRAGFVEFARNLPASDLHDLVRDAEPIGTALTTPFGCSLRRRYERLSAFPEGLLVLGDALCATNPIYGQGLSLGAMAAEKLRACLRRGTGQLRERFFAAMSTVLDRAWALVEFGDLQPAATLADVYLRRLQRAAVHDAAAARGCLRVIGLEASLGSLLAPSMLARALWLGEAQTMFRPRNFDIDIAG